MADTNGSRPVKERAKDIAYGDAGILIRTYLVPALIGLVGIAGSIIGTLVWRDVTAFDAKLDIIATMQANQGAQIAVIQAERAKGQAQNEEFKADIKTDVRTAADALVVIGRAQAADEQRLDDHGHRIDRLEQRR